MRRSRILGHAARSLVVASCIFPPPAIRLSSQMRHRNTPEVGTIEETLGRQEAHIEHDDSSIVEIRADLKDISRRLDLIEGTAKGISYALGSGLLVAIGRIFQKKKDSA